MCEYGLMVGKSGMLNQKPTLWITNSWWIAVELQRRCQGGHQHEPLMGGKATLAAQYPPALCKAVVRGLKKHMRMEGLQGYEEIPEEFTFVEDGAEVNDDEEEDEEHDPDHGVDEEEDEKKVEEAAPTAVTAEDRVKIRRMHVNLGHPNMESFLRFLRAGRVRREVLQWVQREFRCATCQSQALPKAPRPAVVPKCYEPGVALGIDVFFIPDVLNQRSVPVLNVVDLGTNYQMVEVLDNKDPLHIWRTFWRTWARTFGLPLYVAVDEGREFRGGFGKLCASAGVVMFRAAARSPWQQGKVERHGGLLKEMLEKGRSQMPPATMDELKHMLYACECAKNRYSNRSGYSPTQRQIGQWPRMPSSLMSDEEVDPALQSQNSTSEFEKLMEMRRVAQEAFMKVACQEAAARALKARTRLQRSFKAGDLVYVFRVLRQRKIVRGHEGPKERGPGLGRKATWVGPGYVLATEGSVVWVNMMGELWRAAVEQVREATSEEKMGVEIISEDFNEMQERLKRNSHRAGYRDITAQEWPQIDDEEDEVGAEGDARGRPRMRLSPEAEEEDELQQASVAPAAYPDPTNIWDDEEDEVGTEAAASTASGPAGPAHQHPHRQESARTQLEPEQEATAQSTPGSRRRDSPNIQAQLQPEESPTHGPTEEECAEMIRSVQQNQRLDAAQRDYQAVRRNVRAEWRKRNDAPYFSEFSVFFQGEAEEEFEEPETPTRDYWVFDECRKVLQRHHVCWRKALFSPVQSEGSPVPLRAVRSARRTMRIQADGTEEEVVDEWSLFTKKEERKNWWKGITEFEVDEHFLQQSSQTGGPSKKKRGEGEVFPHEISAEEWPMWREEDKAEFEKIVASGALRVLSVEESRKVKQELEAQGKLNRILPSRMVRRYKPGDHPGAPRSRKSRFCIRGDRDPDAIYLSRFAPTVTTSNLQVVIQAAVNRKFRGRVGDLKSAFTQSMPLVREAGPLYCKSCQGSMPDLHEEQLAEIVLGCYGLMDAPLNWRKTLVQFVTEELKYKQSSLDPCTFLLQDQHGLRGIIAIEVDDLLMFGDGSHDAKMEQLQKRFTFGKLQDIDEQGVNFNGRRLRKVHEDILIDMKAFVEERMKTVELSKERQKAKKEKITEEERGQVRSVCGALNWAGREGRPDAAAAASMFSSQLMEMTVEDVLELNKVVQGLKKESELALRIQPIAEDRLRWGVISDASWANARGGKTQAGHMLIAFDKALFNGEKAVTNLLHWKSGKLQRTVNSTLAAETQSLARGVGDLLWMIVVYLEMTDPEFQLREWRKHVAKRGYAAFSKYDDPQELNDALAIVDAKSLYDLLINETTGGNDRRTALDVQVLREELKELEGKIRWIEHLQMPADCLTKKHGRTEPLRKLLLEGTFGITEEATALSERKNTRVAAYSGTNVLPRLGPAFQAALSASSKIEDVRASLGAANDALTTSATMESSVGICPSSLALLQVLAPLSENRRLDRRAKGSFFLDGKPMATRRAAW
eukprot:s1944_g10.t1